MILLCKCRGFTFLLFPSLMICIQPFICTFCPEVFSSCQASHISYTFMFCTLAGANKTVFRPWFYLTTTWNVFISHICCERRIDGRVREGRTHWGGRVGGCMRWRHDFWWTFQPLFFLAHLSFFRPCSADAIMSARAHTHSVETGTLRWLWLSTLPACGLLDLPLCCHHLIAALVQHGGMFMWLKNTKCAWNIFFFLLNRIMTLFVLLSKA